MKMRTVISILSILLITACSSASTNEGEVVQTPPQELEGLSKAYFASGCFWCVEAVFESVKGVKEAISGYSGGTKSNPTYREIGTGRLRHAEAVEVYYDPAVVNFATLTKVFFGSQDPTTKDRQGPDRGPQYRSIAFYKNAEEKKIIEEYIQELTNNKVFEAEIITEVLPFEKFWIAEAYHQNYEKLHPNQPYVMSVSVPRLNRFKRKFPELLKEESGH